MKQNQMLPSKFKAKLFQPISKSWQKDPATSPIFSIVFNFFISLMLILSSGGMIESRQEVIEINDCEFAVFKGLSSVIYLVLKLSS